MKTILITLGLLLLIASAAAGVPTCLDKKNKLSIDNHMAINLRDFREHGFKTRALIDGLLMITMENRQGHTHLEIDLDQDFQTADDRLEVIFNNNYGELPELKAGDHIIACGDFIVDANSPHKAVIHWLHKSPNIKKHDDGYLSINGIVFGK